MVKRTPKRDIDINELKHEFDLEVNRCQSYFELMYKTFNFSFAAIVALVGFVCSLYGIDTQPEYKDFLVGVILYFAIPACLYVFGIMYTYNAYSLAVCGKRAERLHNELYKNAKYKDKKFFRDVIKKYIITNRKITLISYGVPLGFYMGAPMASCYIGYNLYNTNERFGWGFLICSIICIIVYLVLIWLVILEIKKDFSVYKKTNKIKYIVK